jgi:large subunit ribosomal protein L15
MKINDVNRGVTKFKKRKRWGRGPGSGQGKTAGRGHKGQGARAGWSAPVVFQGGTMPVIRRIPKRGFTNAWALKVVAVNVGDLEKLFAAGTEVTPEGLKENSLLGGAWDLVKILGDGELTKALTVSAHRFSKTAQEKIEKAGGKVVVLPGRTPVEDKKKAAREANK